VAAASNSKNVVANKKLKPLPKLTLEKALEYTAEMWRWLAANPNMFKSEWPGWNRWQNPGHSVGFDVAVNDCFCCQYVLDITQPEANRLDRSKLDCSHCPLLNLWEKQSGRRYGTDAFGGACEAVKTAFDTWKEYYDDHDVRTEAATSIANAAQAELDKLRLRKARLKGKP
jgi:hypothetical protein